MTHKRSEHDPVKKSLDARLTERLENGGKKPAKAGTTGRGFGRILVAVYAILAIAATARGSFQLLDHGSEAPVAYALSLIAGIVYIIATLALAIGGPTWRTVAWVTVGFEAVGVLFVGISSLVAQGWFPDKTVWSNFGQGYGYIPLVLPLVGLYWLWRTRGANADVRDADPLSGPVA